MDKPEIKIINVHVNDDKRLEEILVQGYRLIHAIHYINFDINNKLVYEPDGSTRYKQNKENETPMIKYIFERDNIMRLING